MIRKVVLSVLFSTGMIVSPLALAFDHCGCEHCEHTEVDCDDCEHCE